MVKFMAGVVTGVVLSVLTGSAAIWFWPWHVEATAEPGAVESRVMRHVFDTAVARQAPRLRNPVQATDENLMAGMKYYRDGCAGCHGGPTSPAPGERRASIRGFRSSASILPDGQTGRCSGLSGTACATREWVAGATWPVTAIYGGFPCFSAGLHRCLPRLTLRGKTPGEGRIASLQNHSPGRVSRELRGTGGAADLGC